MAETKIEWATKVWNPTVGCSKVSPGCDHCYAARVAHRGMAESHRGLTAVGPSGVDWTGEVRLMDADRVDAPLHWRKPERIFVDSMSDLFHPSVPDSFIEGVLSVMTIAEHHTFQVLTKRPQRMANVLQRTSWDCNGDVTVNRFTAAEIGADGSGYYDVAAHLPNVWWGTSVESDAYTFRIRHLRATPGHTKFLSLEPLLGPLPSLDLAGIDWVICGGESGPSARPMHPRWAHDIRKQCQYDGVPFFFKQHGEWAPVAPVYGVEGDRDGFDVDEAFDHHTVIAVCPSGHISVTVRPGDTMVITDHQPCPDAWWMAKVGKKAAGRTLDGRTWDEYPQDTAKAVGES